MKDPLNEAKQYGQNDLTGRVPTITLAGLVRARSVSSLNIAIAQPLGVSVKVLSGLLESLANCRKGISIGLSASCLAVNPQAYLQRQNG